MRPRSAASLTLATAVLIGACARTDPAPQQSSNAAASEASVGREAQPVARRAVLPEAAPERRVATTAATPARTEREIDRIRREMEAYCQTIDTQPNLGAVDGMQFARAFGALDMFEQLAMREAAVDIGAQDDIQAFLSQHHREMMAARMSASEQVGYGTIAVLAGQLGYAHPNRDVRARRMALARAMLTATLTEVPWICVWPR